MMFFSAVKRTVICLFVFRCLVSSDEDCADGFVRVSIVFPGLKKKLMKNAPSNGNLDLKLESRYDQYQFWKLVIVITCIRDYIDKYSEDVLTSGKRIEKVCVNFFLGFG